MEYFLIFIIATIVGAVGSLQLGLVNSKVICTAISDDHKHARNVAIGGSIPEIFYSALAFWLIRIISEVDINYSRASLFFSSLVLFLAGIYLIRIAVSKSGSGRNNVAACDPAMSTDDKSRHYFLRGLILASINTQLIIFWFAVGVTLQMYFDFMNVYMIIPYSLGAFCGALITLLSFSFFSHKLFNKFNNVINAGSINIAIGIILICASALQLLLLL